MTSWNGYTLLSGWEANTGSQTALAKQGERTVFLKRYKTIVRPENDSIYYEQALKRFNDFVAERQTINRKLSSASPRGGNLVVPHESFVSSDGMYTEVTDYIKDAVRGGETWSFFSLLSKAEQRLVLKTAAAALSIVHEQRIVHSDIKVDNIVIVRNAAGNFVAKLIDFDNSYLQGRVPDEVIGTANYNSPEHALYTIVDEPAQKAAIRKELGAKTDIFSLGVTFHRWLSGEYPERTVNGELQYAWQLAIDEHQTLPLSADIDPTLSELIRKMLAAQPDDRPTANDVLKALCALDRTDTAAFQAPWPKHNLIWNQTTMKNKGVRSVTKETVGSLEMYRVAFGGGRSELLTAERMEAEWARTATGYAPTRAEDRMRWNTALLNVRGVAEIAHGHDGLTNGYVLRRGNATAAFFTAAQLRALEYALPNRGLVTDPEAAESGFIRVCWPEHNIMFSCERVIAFGYIGVELVENSEGLHAYSMVRSDGSNASAQGCDVLLLSGMAVKA